MRRTRQPAIPGSSGVWRWVLAVLALAISTSGLLASKTLYDKKSQYNRIIVHETEDGIRYLMFEEGGAMQTAIDLHWPKRLVLAYARAAMTALAVVPQPRRMLMVGLGGGAMPTFLRRNFPEAVIDVVELDPEVAQVARQFFNFREDQRMKVHIADGRKFIEQTANSYDIIFLDAFGPDSIPYALSTREFLLAVRSRLNEAGVVAANVWSSGSNRLYDSMVRTYQDVFAEVHVLRVPYSGNRIILAMPRKLGMTARELARSAGKFESDLDPPLDLADLLRDGLDVQSDLPGNGRILLDADRSRD